MYTQEDYLKILLNKKYYTSRDLRYNSNDNVLFNNQQLNEYKKFKSMLLKENNMFFRGLDLESFNNKPLFYVKSEELMDLENDYCDLVISEIKEAGLTLNIRHYNEMMISRAYSEIEGSLAVENVPTTRTRIEQLSKGALPKDKNDQIVKNMLAAIKFIKAKPPFNKDNLLKLYNILSEGCLDESQVLNGYYRTAPVYIDRYDCCPVEEIESKMNSLFAFINSNIDNPKYKLSLPHIAHYYIVYVHPYFDYNGRTARMVSLWVSMLSDNGILSPIYLSEAINDNKHDYYEALRETRDMDNDLSYFLIYLYKIAIKYYFVYKNVDEIEEQLLKEAKSLTETEKTYIRKILVHNKDSYFDYKHFMDYINIDASKQGALKMLNRFEEYGILESLINDKKVKLFKVKAGVVKYNIT